MEVTLIFDRGFGSTAVSIAIARQIKLRDLAVQAGRLLHLNSSFLCCSIQEKPTDEYQLV
jgi:hypothetical protein